ncbi:conserved hypothetical protein [Talaromyces stipitatus ATCC 10500]|uniref:Uncharacterized protein n=1 Tax=Talaromyces stipitatus (strain ATCC 10500 / CBS 375.48 / QM 6759 / NRRL 1006) TaxID=441959 RepID=B8M972_TALSN|nr:uncharacterized protein TSTA_112030 [Talaromyces stipitatus ATCC 10500]EED17367.1 conserved hypothetical protein [Talaromyces stipitatus ATCC 10500]
MTNTKLTDHSASNSPTHVSNEYGSEADEDEYAEEEDWTVSETIIRPFTLQLPPPLLPMTSSVVQSHDAKPTESAPAPKFPPPARPGDPVKWPSQEQRIPGKPGNLNISGLVTFDRRDRVELSHCYLERNLVTNGGWLDNVVWVVNTKNKSDLAYLDEILARSPLYLKSDHAEMRRTVSRETMYIKIEDIVWFAKDTIERLVARKLISHDALAISANIVNNPPVNFLHYHAGALHPYLPDLPKGFNFSAPESKAEQGDGKSGSKQVQELAEKVGEHSTLFKALANHVHNITWKSSGYPNWTGPEDFVWSSDWNIPLPNHRWLRVPDDRALNRTPVAHFTYEGGRSKNESWAMASQQHYSLLENIEKEKLNLYKFDRPWDVKDDYIQLSFLAILGGDILDTDILDRLDIQGDTLQRDTGRPILIEGTALAAHFNFMHQDGVPTTDLLARYKSLAADQACLAPSPSASD